MNKLAIITAFLGTVKNRYMTYQKDRPLADKFQIASQIHGLDGLELCYPADFEELVGLKDLLKNIILVFPQLIFDRDGEVGGGADPSFLHLKTNARKYWMTLNEP
jgi:hypothetical protein